MPDNAPVTVTQNNRTYTWLNNWAQLPADIQLGYTHGVAVTKDGRVHVFNQSRHGVVTFNPDGTFAGTWDEFPSDRFVGAHGMTIIEEDGREYFWLTDQKSCEVVKTTLDGQTVLNIEKPDFYTSGMRYCPTWATQSPIDGTIFVTDGYGSSFIHRYTNKGKYIDSWDGSRGSGKFACPHCIAILIRPNATGTDQPVLYVTDRANNRVQVFHLDGRFIKSFYQDYPCCFSQNRTGELLVPDLHAFINIYDALDQPLITKLGDHQHEIVSHDGWPNVPADKVIPGKFNSPHAGTFDADGNIYIVEWIETGRITKLAVTS